MAQYGESDRRHIAVISLSYRRHIAVILGNRRPIVVLLYNNRNIAYESIDS